MRSTFAWLASAHR